MAFCYYIQNNNSQNLLIYFNSLANVGFSDHFLLKATLIENFSDYDILILKDSSYPNWYVPVIPEMQKFIADLIVKKSYKNLFALADSSGAIPLLSCLPNNRLFRRGVVVNGQVDISEEVIYKYEDNVVGSFDVSKVTEEFDKKYLQPLNLIDHSNKFEILFYYNYFKSDRIYADIITNLSKPNFSVKLDFKKCGKIVCHAAYIKDLFTNKNFIEEIKFYFSQYQP
jgi:hypothetical protein